MVSDIENRKEWIEYKESYINRIIDVNIVIIYSEMPLSIVRIKMIYLNR